MDKETSPDPRDEVLRDRFETFRRERERREKEEPKRDRVGDDRIIEQDRSRPRLER